MEHLIVISIYTFAGLLLVAGVVGGLVMCLTVKGEEERLDEIRRMKLALDGERHAANAAVRKWRERRQTEDRKTQDASEEEELR